jgi:hypothetical protein
MTQQPMNMEQIVTRAWEEPAFKQELLDNPKAVLTEAGVKVPDNVELKIVEETPNDFYMIIPKEAVSEMAVEEEKTVDALIVRASRDTAFRQELLNNPKAVIQRELGVSIPTETEVQVLEQTDTKAYMVLPARETTESEELSEEELESVAGGFGIGDIVKFSKRHCGAIKKTVMSGVQGCFG